MADDEQGYGLGFNQPIATPVNSTGTNTTVPFFQNEIFQQQTIPPYGLPPQHYPPIVPPQYPPPQLQPPNHLIPSVPIPNPSTNPATTATTSPDIQTALSNARAIAKKLQQITTTTTTALSTTTTTLLATTSLQTLLQPHRLRIRRALLKNFEYLSRKDDEVYQMQLRELENVTRRVNRDGNNNNIAFAGGGGGNNNNNNNDASFGARGSVAGIGTETRRKHVRREEKNRTMTLSSSFLEGVSLYVCGLPPDESKGSSESQIRHLFGCYGTILRVKLYKDGGTGLLKGDALVVYADESSGGGGVDADVVCSQLNGAELPCGSVIKVQPACFDYKKKNRYGTTTAVSSDPITVATAGTEEGGGGDDDDLDDFFASLS